MALGGGGGGKASDVRAGGAFVEIFSKDGALRAGLARAKKLVEGFGSVLKQVGKASLVLGLAVAAPLAAGVAHFANYGDQLAKMSLRTGISVEALSELAFAAQQSGTSIESLEAFVGHMDDALLKAGDGSQEAREAVHRLGLSLEDLAGMSVEERFTAIADALSRVTDAGDRRAMTKAIGGRGGAELLPLFSEGARGLRALREEARSLKLPITKEDAQLAVELTDAWGRLRAMFQKVLFDVGKALAPKLLEVADALKVGLRAVINFAESNQELIVLVAAVASGLVVAGAALIGFGYAFSGVALGIGAISTLIGVIGSILGALFTLKAAIIAVGVVLVLAFFDKFLSATQQGKGIFSTLKEGWLSFAETVKESWGAIVNAIKAGDLEAAFKVVTAALQLEWAKVVTFWTKKWHDFKKSISFSNDPGQAGAAPESDALKAARAAHAANPSAETLNKLIAENNKQNGPPPEPPKKSVFWADMKASVDLMFVDLGEKLGLAGKEKAQVLRDRILDENKRVWEADRAAGNRRGVTGAEQDEADARKAWQDAVNAANALKPPPEKPAGPDRVQEELRKQFAELPDAVKGAFSAPSFAQVFGAADSVGKRQLVANEKTAEATKKTADLLAKLPLFVFK